MKLRTAAAAAVAGLTAGLVALALGTTVSEGPTSVTRTGGLHFVGSPTLTATKTDQSAFLSVTGEVAGAGETGGTASISATATVTRGCINRGSQGQQPSGLQRSTETTAGTATFQTSRQGRGTFSVTSSEITASNFRCPDQMTPVLVSVTFTDITLTVTSQTGTITATFADIDP